MTEKFFWSLIVNFFFILGQFFVPSVRNLFKGPLFFLLPLIVFCLLGFGLLFSTFKQKIKGKLKKFLILTGVSAAGFFPGVFLHNFFYALAILTGRIFVLRYLMEALHVIFFIVAVFVCPIGFLIGAIGSVIFLFKKKKPAGF